METRLARYCDRVIEAGWLAAAILTPVFFNIYSSRVFEPDKLTLLRSVALIMAAAWLIRTIETWGRRPAGDGASEGRRLSLSSLRQAFAERPLILQVTLLVLVYLLATALSVTPHTTFWGSYQRLQGTYTFFSYIVVFFTAWQTLRTRAQLDRLLNVIILTSLPVGLYGVLQHYGLDPLPWAGDVQERVTGNLGNAIFISAYLIMPLFITVERVIARFRRLLGDEGSTLSDAIAAGIYLFILAIQVLGIYFSKSRGPWLGMLAGLYFFVLISLVAMRRAAADRGPLSRAEGGKAIAMALLSPLVGAIPAYLAFIVRRRGQRWLWLSWCIQSFLAIGFLVVFNLPNSPLAPLRSIQGFGRLGQVFDTEGGTGRVRVLIWEGAVQMLEANPLRTLVGYGPESMYVAYSPYYPPDLAHYEARNASPDRSHNETFDVLITTGVIGFLVYMALYVSIFYYGLRWLGFMPGAKPGKRVWQRQLFMGLAIAGAVLGVLVPLALDHSLRFAGVGIPAGLIAGVAVYLAIAAVAGAADEDAPASFGEREVLLAALLAMIVAHFVEIHFGIAIAATRLYFYLGLAMLLVIGSRRLSTEPEEKVAPVVAAAVPQRRRRGRRSAPRPLPAPTPRRPHSLSGIALGFVGALLLGTLLFDFATNPGGKLSAVQVIWTALSSISVPGQNAIPSPGVSAMVLLTWLLGIVLVIGEAQSRDPDSAPSAVGWYLVISLVGALIFGLFHATELHTGRDLGQIVSHFYVFVLLCILLAAVFFRSRRGAGEPLWRGGWGWLAYPPILVAAGWLVLGNAGVIRADIYYKQAWDGLHRPAYDAVNAGTMDHATAQRYYQAAIGYYDKAIAYAPAEDYYLLFRGKAYLELSGLVDGEQAQVACLQRAEQDLLAARKLNPFNTDHAANLARLYRTWAGTVSDPAERDEKMNQSIQFYEQALQLSPHSAVLLDEWGRALIDMGRADEGLAKYQQSLALDDQFSQTYMLLGQYYAGQNDLPQATVAYEKAVQVDPDLTQAYSVLTQLYAQQGEFPAAIDASNKVLEAYPDDYTTHKNLAILYQQTGQLQEALQQATIARQLAPEADYAALDQFIAQMKDALQQGSNP